MLETRKRLFIILGIIAGLLIAAILIYMFFLKDSSQEIEITESDQTQEQLEETTTISTEEIIISPTVPNEDADERYVRQLARNFVERFGSYSNQNENSHIETVLPLVTDSMVNWLETQAQEQSTEYSGKTTKVIVYNVESFSENSASVHVEVQEILQTNGIQEINYKTGTVNLSRVNNEWKISGLYWD